jgi:hypothetical protein
MSFSGRSKVSSSSMAKLKEARRCDGVEDEAGALDGVAEHLAPSLIDVPGGMAQA